jgi:hypothetical protein
MRRIDEQPRARAGSTNLRPVSSTASPHPDGGLDVVVDPDGTLRVPAAELARHGVRPGSRLRIVTDPMTSALRRSVRGTLTQFVGRILRQHPGKNTVEVHDYHDVATRVLASSLAKRAPGYTSLGFPDPRRGSSA